MDFNSKKAPRQTAYSKDDLIDKLDNEISSLLRHARDTGRGTDPEAIAEKTAYRNAIYNTPLSDAAVQVLFHTDNVLHSIYVGQESAAAGQSGAYDATRRYIEKAERDYLAGRLFDLVNAEYKELERLMDINIIDNEFTIKVLKDIRRSFDPETSDFSLERLRVLMSLENPLLDLYGEWRRSPANEIKDIINDAADKRVDIIGDFDNWLGNVDEEEGEPEI